MLPKVQPSVLLRVRVARSALSAVGVCVAAVALVAVIVLRVVGILRVVCARTAAERLGVQLQEDKEL